MIPVAVVGLSALLPGSQDVGGFWRTVLSGRDLVTDVPRTHWLVEDYYDPDPAAPDKTYGRRGAFLGPVDFEPLAYGVPPVALPATDTTQLLSLVAAAKVLEDATGGDLSRVDGERTCVVLGASVQELYATMTSRQQRPVWRAALRESGVPDELAAAVCDRIAAYYPPWQDATFPGVLSNVISGRIANRFDLHGTNHTTDAACASSFAALSTAVNELALGQADLAITGGVDTLNDISMYMCFSKTPALSPTGDCRPFSAAADGTVLGEGLAMFALKRLADAERDGDRVYAVLRGIGTSSDGRGGAVYAPVAAGQERALRRAYAAAGYGPDTVELVEAHGTGTRAGDAAEYAALRSVFTASGRTDPDWCALGSVKSQIGHTKCAAGAVGLLKAVLALHHKVLPPTIKVDRPAPALEAGPLYLNTVARPWVRAADHPRRASVSSFGFGGTNFHVTAEEYAGSNPAARSRGAATELVLFSAPDAAGLAAAVRAVDPDRALAELARTSQLAFDPAAGARLAAVATDTGSLAADLAAVAGEVATGRSGTAASVWWETGPAEPGALAFLFPGQGSQYPGMGAAVAMEFPAARAVWDRADGIGLGPLSRVVFPVPAFDDATREAQRVALTATEWAQPALGAAALALLAVLDRLGVRPGAVAGHSFGELVALHAAGALDADTLLRLARCRGEAMRDAAAGPPGGMLAVVGSAADVRGVVGAVPLANDNSPRQVVLSGPVDDLAVARERLAAAGIASTPLRTAAAFHSPAVAAAGAALAGFLA
ncbi:MAG: omega-3 polyunsaturated fatty acid synthase subunit, PfaA, partial [uncultured Corynebacteriales bacterium]